MPTRLQVATAPLLDETGAAMLVAYLRGSELYRSVPGVYPNLVADINALIAVDSVKGRQLSAILDALEETGPDGTIGLKGGRYGIQYSQTADREQILALALNVLYDTAIYTVGSVQFGAASARMNCPTGDGIGALCCNTCGNPWYLCNSTCLGYSL